MNDASRDALAEFAEALELARQAGVEIRGYLCRVRPNEVRIIEQTVL